MSAWYPSTYNPTGYDQTLITEEVPLIEEYGVDLVLSGHWHSYERLEKGNCTYMVTGGGGGSLDEWGTPQTPADGPINAQSLAFEVERHSYTVFEIEGQQLTLETWAVDGTLIDNATLYTE